MPNSIMILNIIDTRHKDLIEKLSIIKLIGTLSVTKSQHKRHFYVYFKYLYTEYHDGKCRIFIIMLSVVILSSIMLSAVMLIVIMLDECRALAL
jgi:hypothetical protein